MQTAGINATLLTRVLDWWDGSRAYWAALEEIDAMSPDHIALMAQDVGLERDEFVRVAHQKEGLTSLLGLRLSALGLDPNDIRRLSPLLLGELRRTCACCNVKERCAADLAGDPDPPGWESYCPNAGTLRTLT